MQWAWMFMSSAMVLHLPTEKWRGRISVAQGAQEILATKCGKSGLTYVPPRAY
jgi:uncharacterized OB-fold protein